MKMQMIKACEKILELTDKCMSCNPAKLKGLDYYNSLHNKYKIKKQYYKFKISEIIEAFWYGVKWMITCQATDLELPDKDYD